VELLERELGHNSFEYPFSGLLKVLIIDDKSWNDI
jgi:hypothetical protein